MLLNYYTKRNLSYLTPHSQKKKQKQKLFNTQKGDTF